MKLIDLSHKLDEDTPVFPGDHPLTLNRVKTLERDKHTAYLLSSCLHTGTHIDAPMHMAEDTNMIGDFPPDCFIGGGVLLDVRGEDPISMKPCYEESVRADSAVLLYTGHDRLYGSDAYFSRHPVVSGELGAFLLSRKIKMLGMDTPAPDRPPYTFHRALLSAGIFVLENLTNLQNVPKTGAFEIIALPLKIAAEASFVRAVCRVSLP
ncbi:MAG: cyclase family protein [Oscillospiraceae bacterium]|nr:cyclase family protein [Oscillospiraceae bacterium]